MFIKYIRFVKAELIIRNVVNDIHVISLFVRPFRRGQPYLPVKATLLPLCEAEVFRSCECQHEQLKCTHISLAFITFYRLLVNPAK